MSGGYFDYVQHQLTEVAEKLKERIENEGDADEYHHEEYSEETIDHFKVAYALILASGIYVQRIDRLLSGDDGEETFLKRIDHDLGEIKAEIEDAL